MNGEFPITTQVIPINPKIVIYFRGLGVLCFSEENNRAEIGYLDIEEHDTIISMRTLVTGVDVIGPESMRGKNLEITTPDGGIGKCFDYSNSPYDFDKMIALSTFYGNAAEFKSCANFQSRIYIDDAVFFTDNKSITLVTPYEYDPPGDVKFPMEVGHGLIAHTNSEELSVKYDGDEYFLEDNERYIISILSDCDGLNESDFKHFYDILDDAGPIQYNLQYTHGRHFWLNDSEIRLLSGSSTQFSELYFGKKAVKSDEQKAQALLNKLSYLDYLFFCTPEPCLVGTFANRPRSLPPNCE